MTGRHGVKPVIGDAQAGQPRRSSPSLKCAGVRHGGASFTRIIPLVVYAAGTAVSTGPVGPSVAEGFVVRRIDTAPAGHGDVCEHGRPFR